MSWRIAGRYLEACNCEAICPCRRIGGVSVGRSTYGICFGALSWQVGEGVFDGVDLAGSAAVLTFSYSDDEPGSPWTLVLYVDGADELATILLGEAGGDHILTLPWVRKPCEAVDVRRTKVEFDDGAFRVGNAVRVRATTPVETDQTVSCIVPGHDRPGTELYAEELFVDDEPFSFALSGRCAFTRDFDYSGWRGITRPGDEIRP